MPAVAGQDDQDEEVKGEEERFYRSHLKKSSLAKV
jgi:hypothetical protein